METSPQTAATPAAVGAGASPAAPPPPSSSTPAGDAPAPTPTPTPRQASGGMDEEKKLAMIRGMDPGKYAQIRKRVLELQNGGLTKETSLELSKLSMVVDLYNKAKAAQEKAGGLEASSSAPSIEPAQPPQAAVPSSGTGTGTSGSASMLGPPEMAQLRAQVQAYQQLAHNQPVPAYLLAAAQGVVPPSLTASAAGTGLDGGVSGSLVARTVDAVVDANVARAARERTASASAAVPGSAPVSGAETGQNSSQDVAMADEGASGSDGEKITTPPEPSGPPYAMEFDEQSLVYPYNAFVAPMLLANRRLDEEVANPLHKLQRMMVPSVMPKGLDPYLLMEERNRFVETRMAWRMKELEELEAAHGMQGGGKDVQGLLNGKAETPAGIRARIELMSLRLVGKQRLLREDMVRAMHHASAVPADRSQFRRFRTHTLRDARATETAERRQRSEREQRGKQRHLAYINSICDHGQAILQAGVGTSKGSTGEKARRLGRAMLKMHADVEKEEQRRLEKLAKDRLRALKADDEDAYLALLGEAKDSRIGHLLKQTDSYLETLANAVRDQQNDDVHRDYIHLDFEQEEGPASEAMFGARRQDGEEEGAERKEGKVDYYAVAHRLQEKVHRQATMLTGGTLKDYQVKGLQWMISLYNNRLNGILADEMGLGKTIQTISLITYLIEKKRQPGPFLVIVPLSTLTNWTLEFERWAPSVRTVILKGSPLVRREAYPRLRALDFQVCMTTYEYIIKERPLLSKIKWVHMIIDEGHRMKNVKSKLSQTLNEYYSTRYRLILTGTPLQNNLPELWALLNFVLPKIFNSVKSFDEWFSAPFANTGGEKLEMNEEEQLLVVKRLHKVLRPFLLRRLKKDVESELPDKVEKVIYTKMSALQWCLYDNVKKYKRLPTETGPGKKRGVSLQNAIMQLRKICNHPFVFQEVDEDFAVGNNVDEQIVRTSGKFELLDRILPKLFKTGHKVLIFFQMTEIMTIIADFFDYRGWRYCRLDGSTKAEDRQALLSTFNDPNSPYQVFILSTRAGGLGLNLQSADTVIIYDTDWNPHADLQAQDRAHRIGQKREVRVLRLISSKTVEELVLERAQKKLELDGKVIQAGKFDDITTGAEYEALLAKVFEASGEEENEEANELDDDELNEILARGDDELEIFSAMDRERLEAKQQSWKQGGNKGALPAPLMSAEELPAFYRRDLGAEMAEALVAEEEAGRGRRVKGEVRYTDGLTDEQWLNAVDNSDDDVDDAAERKRNRAVRKAERKKMNQALEEAEADGKPLAATSIKVKAIKEVDERSETPGVKGNKKRARPRQSATPSVQGDDLPQKKRKTAGSEAETAFMRKLFDETNALQSEANEMLNTFFVKPVDKKLYPDYYQLIAQPICMNQIKRKIGTPSYSLPAFRSDMHLLWNNARTYNTEDSWVYNAAQDMQEHFDNLWAEEYPKLESPTAPPSVSGSVAGSSVAGNGNGHGVGAAAAMMSKKSLKTEDDSAGQSGSSTPMFKGPSAKLPPKIKINIGQSKRRAAIVASPEESSASGSDGGDDDDY